MRRPQRVVRIDGGPGGRKYGIGGKPFASVTNIADALPKPYLIGWSAARERELVIRAAWSLHKAGAPTNSEDYLERMLEMLGETKEHEKLLESAGNIGTAMHWRIETELRESLGLPPKKKDWEKLSPEGEAAVEIAVGHYHTWRDEAKPKPRLVERMLYSEKHEYAGTMDVLLEHLLDSETYVSVGDWKSSSGIFLSACLQISAYRQAVLEMGLHDPAVPLNGLIVRLPKTMDELKPEVRFIPAKELDEIYFPAFLDVQKVHRLVREYEEKFPYKWKPKKKFVLDA